MRDLVVGIEDDSALGRGGGWFFENLRSLFLVKKRAGPALHGAFGSGHGHEESLFEVGGTCPSKGSGASEVD